MKDEDCNSQGQVVAITQSVEWVCVCFQEKYYKVCISRAGINESVCEDSHTENVQFASAAVSTSV